MNRREILASMASVLGAGCVVKTVGAEPKPLLFVLEVDESYQLSDEDVDRIKLQWKHLWKGDPPAPLAIVPPGASLKAVVHPDHQIA